MRVVGRLAAKRKPLNQISLPELKKISPLFEVDVANVFDVRRSLAARTATGAPSSRNIAAQINKWRKTLAP